MLQRRFHHAAFLGPQALLWLVIAQLFAVLAHYDIVPVTLLIFAALLVGVRIAVMRGRLNEPGRWSKLPIVVLGIGLFLVVNGFQFTVETAVGFFVLAYGLKMLELKSRRDAYIFGFLSILLLTLGLLFSQAPFFTLYIFLSMAVCLLALMSINSRICVGLLKRNMTNVISMMLLAIPLLVVFYLVFPRFGPLWSMPLKSNTAFTGLGENVSPGDVANLARSGKRAFRVVFNGERPMPWDLYWRSLVLDNYDGIAWKRSFYQRARDKKPVSKGSAAEWDYEIVVDPHNLEWGFALENPAIAQGAAFVTPDGLVRFNTSLKSPTEYRISASSLEKELVISDFEKSQFLRMPRNLNPRTRSWAEELMAQYLTDQQRIDAVMTFFRTESYYYTLNPPLLETDDRVDEFLFDSRRGFCEHYASSFAFLLRAMGIPSRVVVGYQGGEWNQQGGFMVVHQYDAHAWVEAWMEGKGWTMLDPTAAVAPSRVENGIRDAVAGEDTFLQDNPLSLARFSHVAVINWVRNQIEMINYKWYKLVVNYDQRRQSSLFNALFGKNSAWHLAYATIFIAVGMFITIGFMALWPEWCRRRKQPVHYLYERLVRKIQVRYPQVHTGMTPGNLLEVTQADSKNMPELTQLIRTLEQCLYIDTQVAAKDLKHIQSAIKRVKISPG